MGFFGIFKRKKASSRQDISLENLSKEDIIKMAFRELAQESPSRHFASGAVFDLVRQNRDSLEQLVRRGNLSAVQMFFIQGYTTYLRNPREIGAIPDMVNPARNDTNPVEWNFSVMSLMGDDRVVLCFMPIQNDNLSARIFGIVLSDREDGYYYCMLQKGENVFSDVARNKALAGVETIGAVKGRGFELINSFVDCIKKDFYH